MAVMDKLPIKEWFPTDSQVMYSVFSENPFCYFGGELKRHRDGLSLLSDYPVRSGSILCIKKTSFRLMPSLFDEKAFCHLKTFRCRRTGGKEAFAYVIDVEPKVQPLKTRSDSDPFTGLSASVERAAFENDCRTIKAAFDYAKKVAQTREMNLAMLNRFAAAITSTLDLDQILNIICKEMVRIFSARNAGIALLNRDRTKLKLVAFHTSSESEGDAVGLEIPIDGNAATIHVIRSAETIIVPDVQKNPITASFHGIATLRGTHCLMLVPLIAHSEVIGTIGLPTRSKKRVYTTADVYLAQTIASQISGVLENARLHKQTEQARDAAEHELEIGRRIQHGFLPDRLPAIAGWEIAVHFQPARQVAGDFYDVIPLCGSRLFALIIADVCGKGVGAALFMGLFRTLLRAFTLEKFEAVPESNEVGASLGQIMLKIIEHMNHYIATTHNKPNMFATVFYGLLDPATDELTYVNCGHPQPLVVGPRQGVKARLKTTGPVVGMLPDVSFKADRIRIAPEDMLFTFTDGLPDAQNRSGEFLGSKRLSSILTRPYGTAEQLISAVSVDLNHHILQAEQSDDVTMLVIRNGKAADSCPYPL